MRECERQGCEKVLPIDREKLLGSVAMVGHHPTLARPRERSKNEKARMPRRGQAQSNQTGRLSKPEGRFTGRAAEGSARRPTYGDVAIGARERPAAAWMAAQRMTARSVPLDAVVCARCLPRPPRYQPRPGSEERGPGL